MQLAQPLPQSPMRRLPGLLHPLLLLLLLVGGKRAVDSGTVRAVPTANGVCIVC
jgi:hypothetical protein